MTDTAPETRRGESRRSASGSPAIQPGGNGVAWPLRLALVIAVTWLIYRLFGSSPLLVALVILAVVVMIFLHELGHYLAARWGGMKVTEFFIGFGPKLWSFQRGETEYGLKAIPAGAYVRIIGMHNLDEVPPEDEPRTYRQQSFPKRLAVAVAGSTMHFLQAFVLLVLLLAFTAVPGGRIFATEDARLESDKWHIAQVDDGTPADQAGLAPGDQIVELDGTAIHDFTDVRAFLEPHDPGDRVVVTVDRGGERLELPVRLGERPDDKTRSFLGIAPELDEVRYSVLEAVPHAGYEMYEGVRLSVKGLADFLTPDSLGNFFGKVTPDEPAATPAGEPSAPAPSADSDDPNEDRVLSIYGAVRLGVAFAEDGPAAMAFFLVLINLFIGVFNLVPLLPLDGGHVAIATYERLRSWGGRQYHADVAKLLPLTYAVVMFLIVLGLTSLYLDILDPVNVG